MRISESWLREWVSPAIDTDSLAEQLTMAGLEIDAIERLGQGLEHVVVAEITAVEAHPNAEKLRVCTVNAGTSQHQIVCGAPNARVGLKAPLAQLGAELPAPEPGGKPLTIKKAKLRGVESQGMLCAQRELGLGEDDAGLWELPADAPVGRSLNDYLQLPDAVLDVDLTPNRSDCLSVAGVAREVGVLNRQTVNEPAFTEVPASCDDVFPVQLKAVDDCPRYLGRVIRGVDLSCPTPLWMQQKLLRAGVRSIDAAVDVTNYVMLELGQPMHAFDLQQLQGGIEVRLATEGECLTLLDGAELTLDSSCLVIADQAKALALAGIMGGQGSGVRPDTVDLMLEAAHFTPSRIAGRARRFGLHTESSHRFERGVDPELPRRAIERATELLLAIVGGQAGPVSEALDAPALAARPAITLRRPRILQLLGFELPDSEVEDHLQRLGFGLSHHSEGWKVEVPSHRFDVEQEADLLEELARIYGYNRLPMRVVRHSGALSHSEEACLDKRQLRGQLHALGYQEAITYSFIDPADQQAFYADEPAVPLRNPISSEMSVMRTSLLPGLVRALEHNVKRQHNRVRLFEAGQCFRDQSGALDQREYLAGAICGSRLPESWASASDLADFYDLKGDVEALLELGQPGLQDVEFRAAQHPAMHPGQCATVHRKDIVIGHLGALHPRLQKALDVPKNVFLFELVLDKLLEGKLPSYSKISKFPEVRRDLAMLINQQLSVAEVTSRVRDVAGPVLIELLVFDVYSGKGVPEGQKSLGLGLTLQDHSRTLTEEDVSTCLERIVATLEQEFGATLRN